MNKETQLKKICEQIRTSWMGLPNGLTYSLQEYSNSDFKGFVIKFDHGFITGGDIELINAFAKKYCYRFTIFASNDNTFKLQLKKE